MTNDPSTAAELDRLVAIQASRNELWDRFHEPTDEEVRLTLLARGYRFDERGYPIAPGESEARS